MVVPFAIAGVLMVLAVGVHVFVGTRETLALRPTENRTVPPLTLRSAPLAPVGS